MDPGQQIILDGLSEVPRYMTVILMLLVIGLLLSIRGYGRFCDGLIQYRWTGRVGAHEDREGRR